MKTQIYAHYKTFFINFIKVKYFQKQLYDLPFNFLKLFLLVWSKLLK